jgi:DNA-directed RNA polymerase specialized sigma24 family protein
MDNEAQAAEVFGRQCHDIFGFCFQRTGNVHLAGHLALEAFAAVLGATPAAGAEDRSAIRAEARRLVDEHYRRVFQERDWSNPADPRAVHHRPSFCWDEEKILAPPPQLPSRMHRVYDLARRSDRLGREERRCFLLKFFLCKTFDEISLETEIPPAQVKSFVQTAIKTLREELDQWAGTEAAGLRAGEFQSLMLEVRGCSTLDEALLRGHLLADLPAGEAGLVAEHVSGCHCCSLSLRLLAEIVPAAATPALPDELRERLSQELAGRLAAQKTQRRRSFMRAWLDRLSARKP